MDDPDVRVGVAPSRQGGDPQRGLVDVLGQIFRPRQHPFKPLSAGARSRFTRPIPWGYLFIPGAFVQRADSLFDLGIVIYEKPRDGWFSYFRTLNRTEVK